MTSTNVTPGEVIGCANPKLDIFFTVTGTLTDVAVLEFQIFDVNNEAVPIQRFPAVLGQRQAVDVANLCPVGGKLSVGRYVAAYTVDAAEPLGPHEIRWFYRLQAASPENTNREQFEVVTLSASFGSVVSDFRTRFPEFASLIAYPDTQLQMIFDEATSCMNQSFWGGKYEQARRYLVAHLLTYNEGGRGMGATTVTAGPASVSFAAIANLAMQDLNATSYGQRYKKLARLQGGTAQVLC